MISIAEASAKLGISVRRLQVLCAEGRVPRAKQIGRTWVLPDNPQVKPAKYGPQLQLKK